MPDDESATVTADDSQDAANSEAWFELANRLFFRLYQCANILHKVGTRAVESEGLTTQRWAVLGALPPPNRDSGMSVGDLARHLAVSRQSLAGVVNHLESEGLIAGTPDPDDRRSRLLRLTPHGFDTWQNRALPLIRDFYEDAAAGLSVEDLSHALHYFVRLIDNMSAIDDQTRPR